MVYNFVNGKLIIAKMYDEFNIKSRDWESRAPRWIADAMKYLNINLAWEEITEDIDFTDYTFKLPCNIRMLRGIVVNNIKLDRVTTVSHKLTNKEIDQRTTNLKYYTLNNGMIELEQKEGTASVVYRKAPVEWDDKLGMWIPMIPDIPDVHENIAWYVLKIILARGYEHPIYSLTTNRPENNPDYMWRTTMKKARRSSNRMDNEQRRIMAETLINFLSNPHGDIQELFNIRR